MSPDDWPAVSSIYKEGMETCNATFEQTLPTWEHWDNAHLKHSRIVAILEGKIVGWAALSPVSARAVYAGVAEESIYISSAHRGRGIGARLLSRLIAESELNGIWTLQAGVFPENTASVNINLNLGFRKVGYREKIAKLNGVWRDTLLLERRTTKS
jgi:phosphinothricin acetyltransferase